MPLSSKLTGFKTQKAPELKTLRLQNAKCPWAQNQASKRKMPLSSKLTSFKAQKAPELKTHRLNAPELKTHRIQSAKCP
jgi:hypothetical protein